MRLMLLLTAFTSFQSSALEVLHFMRYINSPLTLDVFARVGQSAYLITSVYTSGTDIESCGSTVLSVQHFISGQPNCLCDFVKWPCSY